MLEASLRKFVKIGLFQFGAYGHRIVLETPYNVIEPLTPFAESGVGGMLLTNQFSRFNSQFTFLSDFVTSAEQMLQ